MENQYDPSGIIEMIAQAEEELWQTIHQTVSSITNDALKIAPPFMKEYAMAVEQNGWYYRMYTLMWVQNKLLADLTKDEKYNIDDQSRRGQPMGNNNPAGSNSGKSDKRLTTKNIVKSVITPILKTFEAAGGRDLQKNPYGCMWRRTPKHICDHGPQLDTSLMGTVTSFFKKQFENVVMDEDMVRIRPQNYPALPGTSGEPTVLNQEEWRKAVQKAMAPFHEAGRPPSPWVGNLVTRDLYRSFAKPAGFSDQAGDEERMSLNEFFMGLICVSRGTVGEKALALFQLYAHEERYYKMHHIVPVMHHTTAVVEKVEGAAEKDNMQVFAPPAPQDVPKTIALHFTVHAYSSYAKDHDDILGEVFVPSIHPYVTAGMVKGTAQNFTIWGKKVALPPGTRGLNVSNAQSWGPDKVRPNIGEMRISIKWMPSTDKPEVGQLGIQVHSIRFEGNSVESAHTKNPWVTLCTYDEHNQPATIPRWDPRSGLRKGLNIVTAGFKYGGAYKGHMEWGETCRKDPTGYIMISRDHTEPNHGWDEKNRMWQWGRKWGEQYSTEGFRMRKDFAALSEKANSISLKACRIIALNILRRTLQPINNRQAICLADSIFNRCSAVPGILDAILIKGERVNDEYKTPRQLIEDYKQKGEAYLDVRHHLTQFLDKEVNENLGELGMWITVEQSGRVSLSSLNIKDPFPFMSKVLWLRYVRAGDGERNQEQIPCSADGNLQPPAIKLEMPQGGSSTRKHQAQMSISKEEFLACIQNSALLSESLRQMSLRPSLDQVYNEFPPGKPIVLDVAITDPSKRYEDEDMFDVMNVRQGILCEVWDHDALSRDDFLGECWLPPLGSLAPTPKRMVLPVRNAKTGSATSSRPDQHKNLAAGIVCTGDLHVEASWTIPLKEPPPIDAKEETIETRVEREEVLHQGKLKLKILRAEGLRAPDASVRSRRSADPYVIVYCLNEANGEWRRKHSVSGALGLLDPILRTRVVKSTINPEWNEEKEVNLFTGAFEQRIWKFKHHHFHLTKRGQQHEKDEYNMAVLGDHEELRIYFGDDDKKKRKEVGARHGVEIFLGDTVRQFKRKLMEACRKEAEYIEKESQQRAGNTSSGIGAQAQPKTAAEKQAAKYRMVAVTFKSAVTVFVPSEKLRSLFSQSRKNDYEYKRLYKLEEQDPAYWQPLDPIRTFAHYANTYGFGLQIPNEKDPAQRIRIAEVTGDYKLRNHRYRKFEEEVNKGTHRPDDEDTEDSCFGFGLYTHVHDGGSTEWRPVSVERPDSSSQDIDKRSFECTWLYCLGEDGEEQALDEEKVLLAPHNPKIFGSGSLEHQEFLNQAEELRNQGMNDHDITVKLNESLKAKFDLMKQNDDKDHGGKHVLTVPPLISVSEVKHHLMKLDTEGPPANGQQQQNGAASADPAASPGAAPGAPPAIGGPPPGPSGLPQRSSGPPGGSNDGGPLRSTASAQGFGSSSLGLPGALRG